MRAVLKKNSFALTGWKVMAELPNPASFEAATASVTPDQVAAQFAGGPDPERHLGVAQRFAGAGFDHLVAMNAGPTRTASWTSSAANSRARCERSPRAAGHLLISETAVRSI